MKKNEKEAHAAEVHHSEVWIMDEADETKGSDLWESMMTEAKPTRTKTWKASVDVQQPGFSDTHATGNQQRLEVSGRGNDDDDEKTEVTVVHLTQDASPTQDNSPEEVLSVDDSAECFDQALATNAVPDTACRRTLIGAYTLGKVEEHLQKQGYQVKRVKGDSTFKFGNAGTLVSREVAILPACLGGKRFLVKASILPGDGQFTPLLLSKEFLREMHVRIDMERDVAWFGRLGVEVQLGETNRGHYAVPMFNLVNDCMVGDCDGGRIGKEGTRTKCLTSPNWSILKAVVLKIG